VEDGSWEPEIVLLSLLRGDLGEMMIECVYDVNVLIPSVIPISDSDRTLNCWILDNHPSSTFPVSISSSQTVGFLKAIKDEVKPELDDHATLEKVSSRTLLSPRSQHVHISADDRTFWKSDLDLDTFDLGIIDEGYLKGLESNSSVHGLNAWKLLSAVFTESPKDGHLHIIVHCSSASVN
jgi:Crinkler effector protein N-terminal domain